MRARDCASKQKLLVRLVLVTAPTILACWLWFSVVGVGAFLPALSLSSSRSPRSSTDLYSPCSCFTANTIKTNSKSAVTVDSINPKDDAPDVVSLIRFWRLRIATLMDDLLLLSLLKEQPQQQSQSAGWIFDQVDSLLAHFASRWRMLQQQQQPLAVASSRQAAAQAIDEALLRQAPMEEMELLLRNFGTADSSGKTQTTTTAVTSTTSTTDVNLDWDTLLHREVEAVERQIAAFRQALAFDHTHVPVVVAAAAAALRSDSGDTTQTEQPFDDDEFDADAETANYNAPPDDDDTVDVAIVGAGLGGLCAGAILNTLYGKKVGVYESHYLAGGCAHAFERRRSPSSLSSSLLDSADVPTSFTFDSGPTILLGCSSPPYNGLQQVLEAVRQPVEWIPYTGWGMIENPGRDSELRWRVELGPTAFVDGPLQQFGGAVAVQEFRALQKATETLTIGVQIPALAMRGGNTALIPLLRYFSTLVDLIKEGETLTGTFAPFMDGPLFTVTSPWLRNWLDALAFSLSGLPASRTAAAAMAFILNDMHREGAALDYPKGGMGVIVDALVRAIEQGDNGSKVFLRQHVESIDCDSGAKSITGITLRNSGKKIRARDGVICNAPVWTLRDLIKDSRAQQKLNNNIPLWESMSGSSSDRQIPSSWTIANSGASIRLTRQSGSDKSDGTSTGLLHQCDTAEMTGSFMHLHLAIDARGLDLDSLEAHYTIMDRSLAGDGSVVNGIVDGPCGEGNMIAVSNPCKLDQTLAPKGYIVVHAYMAANEPYERWKSLNRTSTEYRQLKETRAAPLWRAVESIIPDVRERTVLQLIGSPLTHERFLRRPRGTYGASTEDYLRDGSTAYRSLVLASDSVFPGIGVPSVAIAGASAANTLMGVWEHWQTLDTLEKKGKLRIVK